MIAPRNTVRCTATAKSTGEQCKRLATTGATVCVRHGAAAGQVKRAAARRVAEAGVQRRVDGEIGAMLAEAGYGPGAEVDHVEVLLGRLGTARAMCAVLERMVARLAADPHQCDEDGAVIYDTDGTGTVVARSREALYGPDHLGDLRRHPLEVMLGDWTERAARLAKLAADIGIDERMARVAEHQVDVVSSALVATLRRLGVDIDEAVVIDTLADELRAIDAGSSDVTPTREDGSDG